MKPAWAPVLRLSLHYKDTQRALGWRTTDFLLLQDSPLQHTCQVRGYCSRAPRPQQTLPHNKYALQFHMIY